MALEDQRSSMQRGAVLVVAGLELLTWLPYLPSLPAKTWSEYTPVALAYMMFLLVVCPVLAIAGLVLAIRNHRIRLAAILVSIQPIAFLASVIAFAIGVAKYGF